MRFIYPEFLFALFALAIPIIVHLFNFRKFKKIYFTNVRFLHEVKKDTQSRNKLRHLLVLISRMLAISFLVLAFAQPYIPSGETVQMSNNRLVSIFVDNSFSMEALSKNGNLLDEAKHRAREIALAYNPGDQFQLLTHDFESRHQRLTSREEFLQNLDDVKTSAAVRTLPEVLSRQKDLLRQESSNKSAKPFVYIVSDFQRSITQFESNVADSNLNIRLVPIQTGRRQNISIDTILFTNPFVQLNNPVELEIRLRNTGEKLAENIPLKLLLNETQKALASVNIPENSTASVKLSFNITEPGWQAGRISITDYPVTFDDDYYFSLNVLPEVKILCIQGDAESGFFNALYAADSYFKYYQASYLQVDYSTLSANSLIILNGILEISTGLEQELVRYADQGGTLFIIPAAKANLQSYRSLLSKLDCNYFTSLDENTETVNKLEYKHPLFSGVFETGKSIPENIDLPSASKYYRIDKSQRNRGQSLLQFQNGFSFLNINEFGSGRVLTLSVPLDDNFSNFSRHALFVPIFIKAALMGASLLPSPSIIGRDQHVSLQLDTLLPGDRVVHVINKDLNFDVIPESRIIENRWIIALHDQVKKSGNYILADGNRKISNLSFNFDRKESDLNFYSSEELQNELDKYALSNFSIISAEGKNLSHTITQMNEGNRVWKYFILLALLALAAEIFLLKWKSTTGSTINPAQT